MYTVHISTSRKRIRQRISIIHSGISMAILCTLGEETTHVALRQKMKTNQKFKPTSLSRTLCILSHSSHIHLLNHEKWLFGLKNGQKVVSEMLMINKDTKDKEASTWYTYQNTDSSPYSPLTDVSFSKLSRHSISISLNAPRRRSNVGLVLMLLVIGISR